jgi:hypothetical protein
MTSKAALAKRRRYVAKKKRRRDAEKYENVHSRMYAVGRNRASENPISSSTKKWLVIGGLTAVAGVGLYFYMKKVAQLAQMPMPAALPPGTAPINLTLSPGNLSAVTLSAGNKAALSLFAPTGSTLQVMNWNPVAPLAPATTSNYEVVAATPGSSTVTATYKDASGNTQTSTIPVVVTA